MSAIGGENVTTTIEGRERYPVNVRYFRELRDDLEKLKRVLVPAGPGGAGRHGRKEWGIAGANGRRRSKGQAHSSRGAGGHLHHDRPCHDPRRERSTLRLCLHRSRHLKTGHRELCCRCKEGHPRKDSASPGLPADLERPVRIHGAVKERLFVVVPITLFLVFLLLYFNTRSVTKTMIILLAVPFSAIGADLVSPSPRLQYEHCRLGRVDRFDGSRCGDRDVHASLPGSGLP